MKMQNAEMEFVAFDAQDVIATSGGLTAMFTVNKDLYTGPAGAADFKYWATGAWIWDNNQDHHQWLDINGGYPDEGKTYILTEGVSYYEGNVTTDTKEIGYLKLYEVTEGTTANETLTSLAGIVKWLGTYGAKNQ